MPIRLDEFADRVPAISAAEWHRRLARDDTMIGLWVASTSPIVAEIVGASGADWVIIDAEHSPNDLPGVVSQLQALEASSTFTVVRASSRDSLELGRLLDAGARGLMVPRVETGQQAEAAVAATRYPPAGQRGVGGGFARATRWTGIEDYLAKADETFSLIVQIESLTAIENLDEIMAVDGIDAFFFGPADLASSMGHLGQPRHPDVQSVIEDAIGRVVATGRVAGMQAFDYDDARRFERAGARMLAVGADVTILSAGANALIARFDQRR